jgi:hypothetical protein
MKKSALTLLNPGPKPKTKAQTHSGTFALEQIAVSPVLSVLSEVAPAPRCFPLSLLLSVQTL